MAEKTNNKKDFYDYYVPASDALLQKYNPTRTVVFGKIWKLANPRCEMSKPNLAKQLGLSENTLKEAINFLINEGLIEDVTPSNFTSKRQVRYYAPNKKKYLQILIDFYTKELADNKQLLGYEIINIQKKLDLLVEALKSEGSNSDPSKNDPSNSDDEGSKSDDDPSKIPSEGSKFELEGSKFGPKESKNKLEGSKKDGSKSMGASPQTPTDLPTTDSPLPEKKEKQEDYLIDELKTWVKKTYEINDLPKYFDSIIDELVDGKRKNQKVPIRLDYLLEFWQELFESKLKHRHVQNLNKGNKLEGIDRIKYDLSILVAEYPAFEDKKCSIEFERKNREKEFEQMRKDHENSRWMHNYTPPPSQKSVSIAEDLEDF